MLALKAAEGKTPLEVERAQTGVAKTLKRIESAWPKEGDTYPAPVVLAIVGRTRSALKALDLFADERLSQSPEAQGLAQGGAEFIARALGIVDQIEAKVQAAMAPQVGPAAEPDKVQVLVPELRAVPGLLAYALHLWRQLNVAHMVALGWMDGATAEAIKGDYELVLGEVYKMPGAKRPMHWGWKVGLGAVAAGALAGGGYHIHRRYYQGRELSEPDEYPTGIHTFMVEDGTGKIIDAEFTEVDERIEPLRAAAEFVHRIED
jgi:hypothetical protein